eukprot:NODE_4_length_77007_cov_1.156642.p59 type:complete len:170 gc:universal NODE_4_length_77007_cov_1.156642:16679-16170(-)
MKTKTQASLNLKECLKGATVNEIANNPKHYTKVLSQLQRHYSQLNRQYTTEMAEFKKELEAVEVELQETSHEAIDCLQNQLAAYEEEIKGLKDQNQKMQKMQHVNDLKIRELEQQRKELMDKNTGLKELVKELRDHVEANDFPSLDLSITKRIAKNNDSENQENQIFQK